MYSSLKVKTGCFKYQQTDLMNLSPEEIIDRLFKALLSDIDRAEKAMSEGNVSIKCERISHAIAIAGELQASLNMKEGGEIAENLYLLYDFVIRELLMTNLKNDRKRLKNVKDALMPIIEAWNEIVKREKNNFEPSTRKSDAAIKQVQAAI